MSRPDHASWYTKTLEATINHNSSLSEDDSFRKQQFSILNVTGENKTNFYPKSESGFPINSPRGEVNLKFE